MSAARASSQKVIHHMCSAVAWAQLASTSLVVTKSGDKMQPNDTQPTTARTT